jgi:flagellar biosynthesis protein FlhB
MAEGADQDDKTEEPTQRKLDKAIERGDVARSQEINNLFVLGGFALAILISSVTVSRELVFDMRGFLMNAHLVPSDAAGFLSVSRNVLYAILAALAVPFLIFMIAALAGGLVQHRPLWTTEPLMPQLGRISPMAGLSRMFGKEALTQFIKGLSKILIVGTMASVILWKEHDRLDAFTRLDPVAMLSASLVLVLKLMGGVLAIYAFLAMADFLYQKWSWRQRQRMTLQEIRDEYKETDGNPEIKNKLRQLRAAKLKKRMMAAVPSATVVVTNPTHFAVALKYQDGMQAPICVAKGVDALALRIRALAKDSDVPVVENPPLARALHASVDIDEEIPVEHYKAVAEVIGYVLRLRRRVA